MKDPVTVEREAVEYAAQLITECLKTSDLFDPLQAMAVRDAFNAALGFPNQQEEG